MEPTEAELREALIEEKIQGEKLGIGNLDSPTDQVTASIPIQDYREALKNLPANAKLLSIDIGGSLTKVAYFSTVSHRRVTLRDSREKSPNARGDSPEFQYENWENPRLHFIKFETRFIEDCLEFIKNHLSPSEFNGKATIKATGGGARKYKEMIEAKLGVGIDKEDEMQCLIKGANFLLKNVPGESFKFSLNRATQSGEYKFQAPTANIFPYLFVNIGSGVSMLKVISDDEYERVGGTATGGGTFWGIGSLITGTKDFDELLEMAGRGDNRKVDMLVKDIYAGSLSKLGLGEDTIASSFGKCVWSTDYDKADLARSLLFTIANDISQIASLYALRYGLKKIYFGGYFLRNHPVSMAAISFSIKYWGKGDIEAMFLRHEGYVGALGAFLMGTEDDEEEGSWTENYVGSTHLLTSGGTPVEQLAIDKYEPVGFLPLLHSTTDYMPDSLDLALDAEAREYWMQCFATWIDKVPTRALESQPKTSSAVDRALRCRQKLLSRLQILKNFPFAFGNLSIRSLLDMIEQTLREYDFPDPYLVQKQAENRIALIEFPSRIQYIDSLEDPTVELIKGVLAGNFFDWGAKEIAKILEGPDMFGFLEARNKLLPRPWLVDKVDDWIDRIQNGPPHKCVLIFVDNSGYDFILGALPLVRWFLKRGSQVILTANSQPALNDMTYREMFPIIQAVSMKCSIIREAVDEKRLHLAPNGQSSPCLDLSRVSHDLIRLTEEKEVDLVVIEGMGRAIHTNLLAKFNCEVIKLAVIKNQWLGRRLGGDIYSIVFQYER